MNPRSRRVALYAIGVIAILASVNALTHSYAGLYDWAVHHRLGGWQAMSWPAEIDVFLAIGELSLYVAYLDGWSVRHRVWPWVTAITGLTVSVAGNIGHIQAEPGHPVLLADRLTAASSPIAAFAGLAIGLLVLKMTREQAARPGTATAGPAPVLAPVPAVNGTVTQLPAQLGVVNGHLPVPHLNGAASAAEASNGLLHDASVIYRAAAASGERISQRALARQLRGHGHRFANGHLRQIAASAGMVPGKVALSI